MSAAIQNEVDRLRAERDALQQQLNESLEREAALAAHVERLMGSLVIDDDGADIKKVSELKEVISQSPTTNLARRDLIKQAEVLENHAENLGRDDRAFMLSAASDLRQSAQELTE